MAKNEEPTDTDNLSAQIVKVRLELDDLSYYLERPYCWVELAVGDDLRRA